MDKTKYKIILKAVPPAQQFVYQKGKDFLEVQLPGDATIAFLIQRLNKQYNDYLKDKSLILYCGNNFAMCPSAYIKDIYDNFNVSGKIIVNYAISEAWG